jgi:hypothetical protein
MEYILPINATTSPKVNLVVKVPENMSTPQQDISTFMNEKVVNVLYSPKNEQRKDATSFFQITKVVGGKLSSRHLMAQLIASVLNSPRLEIIRHESRTKQDYEQSQTLMQYELPDGRPVFMFIEAFGGPYDSCGVLYSRVLNMRLEASNPEELEKQIKEVSKITSHINVVKDNGLVVKNGSPVKISNTVKNPLGI